MRSLINPFSVLRHVNLWDVAAFDAETGKELWSHKLPFIGSAPPTVYEVKGEQYIVIPATGGSSLQRMYPDRVESGDTYVAFKLEK